MAEKKKVGTIRIENFVQRNQKQEYTTIDDEVVMLCDKEGQYYALNSVASSIWEHIADPIQVLDLIEILTSEFDIDRKKCIEDTLECLYDFHKKSLLNNDTYVKETN